MGFQLKFPTPMEDGGGDTMGDGGGVPVGFGGGETLTATHKTFYTKWFVNQTSRADEEPHNSWPGAVWRMQCWLFLPHFLCSCALLSMGFCFEFAILSRLGSSIFASIWFHLKGTQNMEIPPLKIRFSYVLNFFSSRFQTFLMWFSFITFPSSWIS